MIGACVFFVGLMFAGAAWQLGSTLLPLYRRGIRTSGTVVDSHDHDHYTGKGGGYTSTSATIRFRDEHGDKHEILWNGTYGRRYYERGKTVPVSFLPGQAKDAQITTTRRFWLSIVVPVVLGAVMLPVGALGAIGVLHY
jgi:hypothetical protein